VGPSVLGGLPGSSSGGLFLAFGWKLFIEAQAFTGVLPTERSIVRH
jgi:hypothetical protein